jgi:hypothetical protein
MKNTDVHHTAREDIKRTVSPADMLISTTCYDVYRTLTLPQKALVRMKQLFLPRDTFIDEV